MKLLLVAAVGLFAAASLMVDSSDALFLGQGGVFNSPEAQQSFNSRYVQSISAIATLHHYYISVKATPLHCLKHYRFWDLVILVRS